MGHGPTHLLREPVGAGSGAAGARDFGNSDPPLVGIYEPPAAWRILVSGRGGVDHRAGDPVMPIFDLSINWCIEKAKIIKV